MTTRRTARWLVAAIALAVAPSPARSAGPSDGFERARGRFLANCAVCHGPEGRADTPVARLLDPAPRNFTDPIEMARVGDDRIYRAIKEGRPGTAMAPWGALLTEIEIGDLVDFIRTLVRPLPAGMTAEQLSLEVGRRIYREECAECHGAEGKADTPTARALEHRPRDFTDHVDMARVDDGRMYAAVALGRVGTAMGGWRDLLGPVEIIDVMRYVRSLEPPWPSDLTAARLDVLVGERLYTRHCAGCHGPRGDGQTDLGRALVPRPRNFTSAREMAAVTDQRMSDVIAHGSPGTAMAPWSGILNPEDIRRVVLYIRQAFPPGR